MSFSISFLADIASIIGLLITFWIFFKIKSIQSQFLFIARFPMLLKAIRRHSSIISSHLDAFPDSAPELEIELKKCLANLRNLKTKVRGETKNNIKKTIKQINKLPNQINSSKRDIQLIYQELLGIEVELKNYKEDTKWRTE